MTVVQFPAGAMMVFLSSPTCPELFWGPASLLLIEYRGSLPGLKRQGLEAVNSTPYFAKVKNV
jgi:hypothetical protein